MKEITWSKAKEICGRPCRVCWAVARHKNQQSICPLGWKMQTSMNPLMFAVSIAPPRFTHDLILNSAEMVIAWPDEDLAQATLDCGTQSGRDTDKFEQYSLTPVPATDVSVPLVKECAVNMECTVNGRLTSGDHTIFAAEVLRIWVNPDHKRQLCLVDDSSGFETLLKAGAYRFGAVKK